MVVMAIVMMMMILGTMMVIHVEYSSRMLNVWWSGGTWQMEMPRMVRWQMRWWMRMMMGRMMVMMRYWLRWIMIGMMVKSRRYSAIVGGWRSVIDVSVVVIVIVGVCSTSTLMMT